VTPADRLGYERAMEHARRDGGCVQVTPEHLAEMLAGPPWMCPWCADRQPPRLTCHACGRVAKITGEGGP
jgi:hypothetical protein